MRLAVCLIRNQRGSIVPILFISVLIAIGLITFSENNSLFTQGQSIRSKAFIQSLNLVRDSISMGFQSGDAINETLNFAGNPGNQNLLACVTGTQDCMQWTNNPSVNNQIVIKSGAQNIINDPTSHGAEIYGISATFANCNGGLLCGSFELQRGICNNYGTSNCNAQFNTYFVPVCPPAATCLQPAIHLRADLVFADQSIWLLNPQKFSVDVVLGP